MVALNLNATTTEHNIIKDYLQANASDVLKQKINNGVRAERNGKELLNKKDLDSFLKYACKQAQENAETGARAACVGQDTVFGWAIHYFEEDSIEGTLYNIDGTEYKPEPIIAPRATKATGYAPTATPKAKAQAVSMFDLMGGDTNANKNSTAVVEQPTEPIVTESPAVIKKVAPKVATSLATGSAFLADQSNSVDDNSYSIEIEQAQTTTLADNIKEVVIPSLADDIFDLPVIPVTAPILKQIDETKFVDDDGVVHNNSTPVIQQKTTTAETQAIPAFLQNLLGNILIARLA